MKVKDVVALASIDQEINITDLGTGNCKVFYRNDITEKLLECEVININIIGSVLFLKVELETPYELIGRLAPHEMYKILVKLVTYSEDAKNEVRDYIRKQIGE